MNLKSEFLFILMTGGGIL